MNNSWKRLCMKILILKWFHTVVFCLEEIKPYSIYLLMPFKNGHCISFLFSFFLSFLSGSQIYDPTEFQDKFYPHEQRKEREKNIYEMHYSLPRAKCNPGKGQLNSEWIYEVIVSPWIYEVIVSPKIPTKTYRDFWSTL